MTLLVLTKEGFEDLRFEGDLPDFPLYISPGLIPDAELAQLVEQGRKIHLLPKAVDPSNQDAVQEMIQFAEKSSGRHIWVEVGREKDDQALTRAPALPENQGRTLLPLHLINQTGKTIRSLARFGFTDKQLFIIPYLGYGNAQRIMLRGRVLEEEGFDKQADTDGGWKNLLTLYKRLESDQVANARVRAKFQGIEQEAVTDRGGYFFFDMKLSAPLDTAGWHTVELELLEPLPPRKQQIRAQASVLVPPVTARFGVISDIDDTILWTNVTNKLNMMLMLARSNAHTRKPFKGVTAFYRALQAGMNGEENNPLFYVSSSPWHLFTPLLEFLQKQDIPLGPLMLKELSFGKLFGSERHRSHKLEKIEAILNMYPKMKFVLIGDSGEHDPEIYAEVVRRHPDTVSVIYIRNVNPDPSRIEAIDRLIEEVRLTGTQLILVPDSEYAAAHAASEGLIQLPQVRTVRLEKQAEQQSGHDITGLSTNNPS